MQIILTWLKIRWVYHSLVWIFLTILFFFLLDILPEFRAFSNSLKIKLTVITLVESAFLIYSHFYIRDRFFKKGSYMIYLILLVLSITLYNYIDSLLMKIIFPDIYTMLYSGYLESLSIIGLSVSVQYFKRGIANQYKFKELKAKSAQIELQSLKTQINPHFLFNNLNNIYALNSIDPKKGSEMILELADVMRYHLEFSKLEYINLVEEIHLIQAYIALEKLRLNDNCTLAIDIQKPKGTIYIAPLLLLPFIENAFKHGTHPKLPCFITMCLSYENDQLTLSIQNSVIRNKKVVKTGIGLHNTKKRLDLLYRNHHQLSIEQMDHVYQVQLNITL